MNVIRIKYVFRFSNNNNKPRSESLIINSEKTWFNFNKKNIKIYFFIFVIEQDLIELKEILIKVITLESLTLCKFRIAYFSKLSQDISTYGYCASCTC